MSQLTLRFLKDGDTVSLVETVFSDPLLAGELSCLRGSGMNLSAKGSFRWSPAVQALSLLFVEHAAAETGKAASISGGAGTPAASLDYAISKQPNWMLDMFGVSSDGITLLRRVVCRENSERRRPGPVVITVKESKIRNDNVVVFLNGEQIEEKGELTDIRNALEKHFEENPKKLPTLIIKRPVENRTSSSSGTRLNGNNSFQTNGLSIPVPGNIWRSHLRDSYVTEAKSMLQRSNIFQPRNVQERLTSLSGNVLFQKLTGRRDSCFETVGRTRPAPARLGLEDDEVIRSNLNGTSPIRIAVPLRYLLPSPVH